MFYLGLPQWQHAAWAKIGLHDLADYSRHFNCVEGNTTFYALPTPALVRRWRDMTHDGFRFCFKFPSAISHQAALLHCDQQIGAFYRALQPLDQRLGQLWLQLPAACGPEHLSRLWAFLDALPRGYRYGVEVRHPAFFAKGDAERELNRGLRQRAVNRVLLDSRPVHHALPHSHAVREAQRKKPHLPAHALITADAPMVRFVGGDSPEDNLRWLQPWLPRLQAWSRETTPYLFIHTPDCRDAPQQAQFLWNALSQAAIDGLPPRPDWPLQTALF
ncbi:DUF72 domain-containing protein [Edwardsiella piscicida]|uniref:DUF72 domain-containing protein n=1 Tax=Edwardsiella piscicida TaxID=1263550 RepID=UPI0002C1020B|nr:DUF72 domain-containing protein [Edwardsiella piscicida]AGH73467.1 hypothetical protein ETAC_06730 [Edwardsiella piscicida C07-087]EKS7779150.1 DUF72 domain-containing protein [Edwardsiella piscicida]EKS7782570.1 DUF72 domain-containing protein [Edwardsiella piscicida]EKS7811845.1 DUF72 domain-containing protein [Edwardsiella piscicida]UCQ22376.1 DUF72 domain-containing protein [Edwardsiella piscicida]